MQQNPELSSLRHGATTAHICMGCTNATVIRSHFNFFEKYLAKVGSPAQIYNMDESAGARVLTSY